MPTSDNAPATRAQTVVSAWETLRADKSFAGMTLTQFKNKVKPSFDARTPIVNLKNQLTAAQNARDDADKETLKAVSLVVNSVKGDPDEGEDGELYEAMGYVRKSERKSGLAAKVNNPNRPLRKRWGVYARAEVFLTRPFLFWNGTDGTKLRMGLGSAEVGFRTAEPLECVRLDGALALGHVNERGRSQSGVQPSSLRSKAPVPQMTVSTRLVAGKSGKSTECGIRSP